MSRLRHLRDTGHVKGRESFDVPTPTPEDKKKLERPKNDLQELGREYINDIRSKSECPETLKDAKADVSSWKKLSPEENQKSREEFNAKRSDLKRQWEKNNGREWPKYDSDVVSSKGTTIRRKGQDYDAHHIQPLNLGGKNDAENITPLHANSHFDSQGVHSPDSPYAKIQKEVD